MATQLSVANALSALDDKMDNGLVLTELLLKKADLLFRSRFTGVRAENFPLVPLATFGHIVCGSTPPKRVKGYYGGGAPFVKIPDLRGNVYVMEAKDTLTEEGFHLRPSRIVPAGSVCVSTLGTVGLVSLAGVDLVTNQQIQTIVPRNAGDRLYLFCLMRSMFDQLATLASCGTVTPIITSAVFSRLEVRFPSRADIDQFNSLAGPFFAKMLSLARQRKFIQRLKAVIMNKLVNPATIVPEPGPDEVSPPSGGEGFPAPLDLIGPETGFEAL